MNQIDRTLKRLRVLYYMLLAIIVCSIAISVSPALRAGIKGVEEGEKARVENRFQVKNLQLKESKESFHLDADSNVQIRITRFDVSLKNDPPVESSTETIILNVLRFMNVGAVLLFVPLFLFSLYVIGRSVMRKDIFNSRSIFCCRSLSCMILLISLSFRLIMYIERSAASRALENTNWETASPYFSIGGSILTALIIYIFAEVLSIGRELKKEQDLTV